MSSPTPSVRTVIGTLVYEPVLLALRRLAQVDASARRFNQLAPFGSADLHPYRA